MYCVNCGVKLADTEKQCPLCGTVPFHPDITRPEAEALYPNDRYPTQQFSPQGALIVVSAIFLIPMVITLLCDLSISNMITWSGYVIGALIIGYIAFVLPSWFKKPNPVVFVPCCFAVIALYLLYINYETGGKWFLTLALPVTAFTGLVVTAVVTLIKYVGKGILYIIGGALIAFGLFMPLMEYLINYTFDLSKFTAWSMYPLTVLVIIGAMLIFLAVCRPARETMERKFFIG